MIVHASCVALDGRAVLLSGRSGAGKSDLALRLVDRGARLVGDDYISLSSSGGRLLASPPPNIEGRIEVRGVGIVERPFSRDIPVCLFVELDGTVERMPEPRTCALAGFDLPCIALNPLEASAPLKVEAALDLFGLKP